MHHVLVIRFGALGDLCLLGATLARLAAAPGAGQRRVTLVTKAAFAPLMQRMRGVDRVVALESGGAGALWRLAARLRGGRWDTIIDAHGVLRSRLLLGLLGRRPAARLAKDTVARLALLRAGRRSAGLERSMRDRFDELAGAVLPGGLAPGLLPDPPPLEVAAAAEGDGSAPIGLAPGAQWETKRWPEARYAALVGDLAGSGRPVRLFLGPREGSWYEGGPLQTAARRHGVEVVRDQDLPAVAALLGGCRLLVCNDSGLLHLAEAVGTPVVACFGPTVREFGYFPALAGSAVVQRELDCRPCSRNGKAPCHRGDLACLEGIGTGDVRAAMADLGDAP